MKSNLKNVRSSVFPALTALACVFACMSGCALNAYGSRSLLLADTAKPAGQPTSLKENSKVIARHKLLIGAYEFGVTRNLDVASEKIGYFRLKPGGTFSLNKFLGKRTAARGYKRAPVYAGAGARIKDFGGGLCMVSSVLYNIFLRGGLEIVERHPHRKVVSYVPAGLDAAVDYGSKDLRVRNNRNHTIVFRVYRTGKIFHGELTGPPSGSDEYGEIEIKRSLSRAMIPGVVRNGFRVRVTRTFFQRNGELLREEILSEDTFLPINYKGVPEQ